MADGRANNKGNPQNFHKFDSVSPEEKFKVQSMGGIASSRVRRAKKEFRELAQEVLDGKVDYPLGELEGFAAYDKKFIKPDGTAKQITIAQRIILAMAKKAIHGDVGAAQFIRDSAGQAPIKQIQAQVSKAGFDVNWGDVYDEIDEKCKGTGSEMEEGVTVDGE